MSIIFLLFFLIKLAFLFQYEYLRKLFKDLMDARNYVCDYNFDWLEKMPKPASKVDECISSDGFTVRVFFA